ncbi:MAG: D-2-hydroxyacid dehydrogenase [Pseudomonadota bacterium]
MKVLISGAENASELPGLDIAAEGIEILCAPDEATLRRELPGTEVLLGWNFRGRDLQNCWDQADSLRWIQWFGAGVDAVIFPGLADSEVTLTNQRGIFDTAMAEYVLGYMIAEVKKFEASREAQRQHKWRYSMTRKLAGQRAAVFGVGSIGREVARLLTAVGVEVIGVGRRERADEQLGTIRASSDALAIAADVDWCIGVLPSTPASDDYFTAEFFAAMPTHARFVNIGRGRAQDETALAAALHDGSIAGAMVDVFRTEPLPDSSELWDAPNLFISPHMSGDYAEFETDMVALFNNNFHRYCAGEPLRNVVDKALGFVASS